jgi:hypothetical protein
MSARHQTGATLALAVALLAPPVTRGQEYQLGATVPGPARIDGRAWFSIGPAPLGDFSLYDTPYSGRATAIAVNPVRPDEVWLGTASGGVWHSGDAGHTWRPLTDGAPSLTVGAIAVEGCDAGGCARIWVGTGENALRRDTGYGGGLLLLTPDEFGQASIRVLGEERLRHGSINNIVLRGGAPGGLATEVWITVSRGLTSNATQSAVHAPPPAGGYGIHRLSFAGVAPELGTWERFAVPGTELGVPREGQELSEGALPTDLEIDPTDANVLYAGFLGVGAFVTPNAGETWCPLGPAPVAADPGCPAAPTPGPDTLPPPGAGDPPFDWVELALPEDASRLYVMLGRCAERVAIPEGQEELFVRRAVGPGPAPGLGWEAVGGRFGRSHCRYTHSLTVDPRDPDVVYAGAIRIQRVELGTGAPLVVSSAENIHPDVHAVVFTPTPAGQRVYVATDGGFYGSAADLAGDPLPSDFDRTLLEPRNDDLVTALVQSIGVSSVPGSDFGVIGTQDNGCYAFNGTRRWPLIGGLQDCGSTFVDARDPLLVHSVSYLDVQRRVGLTDVQTQDGGLTGPYAFYRPLVQDPNAPADGGSPALYVGTDRVFRSRRAAGPSDPAWEAVSGVFAPGIPPFPATARPDVVTALAVTPGMPGRLWAGTYGGAIWVSDPAAFPCGESLACWSKVGDPTSPASALPAAPVTSFAIPRGHPTQVWATYSGFGFADHVFLLDGTGAWMPRSGGLGDVPANVLAIEEHPEGDVLWLGSDRGVHRSANGGFDWESSRPVDGLPNVPVYDIAIDQRETSARLYAATHGRGVFVLTQPFLTTLEGWVDGDIWDIPIHGTGFPNEGDACTVRVLLQDGSPCAEGREDQFGRVVVRGGALTTDNPVTLAGDDRLVVFGCFNGECVGGATIESCNADPGNRIASVEVRCDSGVVAFSPVRGTCPVQADPPSTLFGVSGLPADLAGRRVPRAVPERGAVDVIASVQVGDGSTHALCAAAVPFAATDTPAELVMRARDALNASPACATAGVTAAAVGVDVPSEVEEDQFGGVPGLLVRAPGAVGGQLVTAFRAHPGGATGLCLRLGGMGVPHLRQALIAQTLLETPPAGASGGTLQLVEHSTLGRCAVTVATRPGDGAADIAARLAAAFQDPALDSPDCPTAENPRDVRAMGARLITVLPSALEVCSHDDGIGFFVGPKELAEPSGPIGVCRFDAADSARVGNGTTVEGSLAASPVGGRLKLACLARMADGTVAAADLVRVGSRASAARVLANTVERGRGAEIRDGIAAPPPALPEPFCPIEDHACGGEDVVVQRGDGTVELAPGSYGRVLLRNGARLVLAAGAYDFCALRAARGAAVEVAAGLRSTLHVAGELRLGPGSRLVPAPAGAPPVVQVAGRRVRLGPRAAMHGFLAAPHAWLSIGRQATLAGTACAERLTTSRKARLACGAVP